MVSEISGFAITGYHDPAAPPITPELQEFMDDQASKTLLALSIVEELGLDDFGKA